MVGAVARYAIARGLPGLVTLAALALFTRLLTEYEYGQYALVVAGVALGNAFFIQWVGQGVLRLVVSYPGYRGTFLATVLHLFVPLVVVTALLLAVGIGAMTAWHNWALMAAAAGFLSSQSWHELNLNLAVADRLPMRFGVLSLIRAGFGLALGGLAGWLSLGATGVLAGVAMGGIVSGIWVYWIAWKPSRDSARDRELRRELFRYGVPLAGASVLAYVISAADRFLLGVLISPAAAGLYAPAYDLVLQAMVALLLVVNLGAYPLAIQAVENRDPVARERHFRQHAALLLFLAVPAAAGIAMLAPSISEILGPRFSHTARQLIPLLALAQLLAGLKSFYFDLSFQLGRATRLQLVTVASAALVNVLLNLWLIPVSGLLGAAYATIVAYSVAFGLSIVLGRRVLVLPIPYGALAKVGVATLVMCCALVFVRDATGPANLVGQVVLGGTVYMLIILVLTRGKPVHLLGR